MLRLIDGPRFRNGHEVKTPSVTRNIKEQIAKKDTVIGILDEVPKLFGCPAVTRRTPKTFDKQTGEPKTYSWIVQSEKISRVLLTVDYFVEEEETTICRISYPVFRQITDWLDGKQKSVITENALEEKSNVLLSPLYGKGAKRFTIVGVEATLIEAAELLDIDFPTP